MTDPKIPAARLFDRATREVIHACEADRLSPKAGTPAILDKFEEVIRAFPFARLVRDGVGDRKYTIDVMGSSRVLGTASSAFLAWEAAHAEAMLCQSRTSSRQRNTLPY